MVGNKAKKAIAAALSGAMVLSAAAPAIAGVKTDGGWYRINGDHLENYQLGTVVDDAISGNEAISGLETVEGENRYDTMFDAINYEIENAKWEDVDVTEVVLASGTSQADALVAAGLAGTLNGINPDNNTRVGAPVITTDGGTLSVQAKRAIKYFLNEAPKKKLTVYIVGGEAAISSSVEDAVIDIDDDNIDIERIAGADRTETSLKAMKEMHWLDDADENDIYVANGTAWADALSVSSFAYSNGKPIVLTSADGKLTADQIEYLKDSSDKRLAIRVIGGKALPSVEQLYDEGFDRTAVEYIGGKDRYETSAMVVDAFMPLKNPDRTYIAIASGNDANWPDALIGGPFIGSVARSNNRAGVVNQKGVLVLVDGIENVTALKAAYKKFSTVSGTTGTDHSFIIGGEAAISDSFANKLDKNFPAGA